MEKIDRLKNEIENADVIVIGAGAGLSTSAGFIYTGERFSSHFADFEQKYGFHDMYTGGFYPFKTLAIRISITVMWTLPNLPIQPCCVLSEIWIIS